jgi:hypothetical protein
MRLAGLVALILVAPCSAQSNLWTPVGSYSGIHLRPAELSQSQRKSIAKSIVAHGKTASQDWGQDCTVGELVDGSTWEMLPVSPSHKVLLLEAGSCARGGQGANGAMWIVRWDGVTPVVLASPEQQFSGWIYSVQPSMSYGYRDIVVGWHMSAAESGLSYFRFDGKRYRCIGNATSTADESGSAKIVPTKPSGK